MDRMIVTVSGGKSSAWCVYWALSKYPKEDVILYFNDTGWEHPDLYRFLADLEIYFNHKITRDSDGRNPENLFYDNHALANDRMPFCSRELKAKRLQKFFQDGDTLVFGIGHNEIHRAHRIIGTYQTVAAKTKKTPALIFPLVSEKISKEQVDKFFDAAKIKTPLLYDLGFSHNNCSGGCVRCGKKQWALLLDKLPDVYADRERVEREVGEYIGKDVSFMKDETLTELRERIQNQGILPLEFKDEADFECFGACGLMA